MAGLPEGRAAELWRTLASEGALVAAVDNDDHRTSPHDFEVIICQVDHSALETVLGDPRVAVVALMDEGQMRELAARTLPVTVDFVSDSASPLEIVSRVIRVLGQGPGRTAGPAARDVVVADDDPSTLMIVKTALEANGFHCTTARDGTEALRAIRTTMPAAVILDLQMPFLSGLEVLRTLRSDGRVTSRILILTSTDDEMVILDAFAAGADDFVVKPFRPAELIARLERMLR